MTIKTYTLLTDSRQFPMKKAGDTVDLPAAAAKYLLQAGVLAEKAEETAAPAKPPRKSTGAEA